MSRIKKLTIALAATAAMALPATAAAADGPAAEPAPPVAGTQGDKCWFGWPFQWLCFEIDPPSCIPGQICPAGTNGLEVDGPSATTPY